MIGLTITLGILCIAFAIAIATQDGKNAKLTADNALMKGRVEEMEKAVASRPAADDKSLTIEGIADAVRHLGFTPECEDGNVLFNIGDDRLYIDARRLPVLFVNHIYNVETEKWNLDIMRRAAHLVSDELVMVKALVHEDQDGATLRFFVAAMDRTATSLKYNLRSYLGLINDASNRLMEIYDGIVKEQDTPADILKPLTDSIKPKDNVAS